MGRWAERLKEEQKPKSNGRLLLEHRKKLIITRYRLAKILGIDITTIFRWETNRVKLNIHKFVGIKIAIEEYINDRDKKIKEFQEECEKLKRDDLNE